MNKADELVYLGRIISLLARHEQLTLGEIKNKTRSFLRKRHQTDSSVFRTLESFCKLGVLRQTVHRSRIYYELDELGKQPTLVNEATKLDMIEAGVDTENELFKQMAKQGLQYMGLKELPKRPPLINQDGENLDRTKSLEYQPKQPPSNDVKGFK